MKKLMLLLTVTVCILLSGCSNAFAKEQYNDDQKIAASDHYAATTLNTTQTDAGCSFEASTLDGWITVWKYSSNEDTEVNANVSIGLKKGTAKIVHIDGDGNVSTLMEYEADGGSADVTGKGSDRTIRLSKGENRIKIAGYDCEDVEMSVEFK